MKNKSYLITFAVLSIAMTTIAQQTGTFTDTRDGKVYKTIKIGTQTWMTENLAYKTPNGCWAYNDDEKNVAIYGYLYNWETAESVCPTGWLLPGEFEFSTMINYLGGKDSAGCKLKEVGNLHWKSNENEIFKNNVPITNSTGFTALPGGLRNDWEIFSDIGRDGWWWSIDDQNSSEEAKDLLIEFNGGHAFIYSEKKECGLSVRCIKDK